MQVCTIVSDVITLVRSFLDKYFRSRHLVETSIAIINEQRLELDRSWLVHTLSEGFLKVVLLDGQLLAGCNPIEASVRNEQVPRVAPQERIAFRMYIARALAFF